jgi:thiamine-phosphate pyrophosphorylase
VHDTPFFKDRSRLLSAVRLDPFYPILPDAAWVARIVRQGAKFIQLRVKDGAPAAIKTEITQALAVASTQGCQLVVNDFWREAINLGADFVHLGQGDLAGADLDAIRTAGIKLGISTHSLEELDNALAVEPAYVALGPIYQTKLKLMPWQPLGLARIGEWLSKIRCPLVAIGGITLERSPEVLAAGASSAAVATDIVMSPDPELRAREWLVATAPWRDLSTAYPPISPA